MTTDWTRPLRSPPAYPDILTYQGVRVVRIEEFYNMAERRHVYRVTLEDGGEALLTRHDFETMGPSPRHLMVSEKDDNTPRGLQFAPKEPKAPEAPGGLDIAKMQELQKRRLADEDHRLKKAAALQRHNAEPSALPLPPPAPKSRKAALCNDAGPRGLTLPSKAPDADTGHHDAVRGLFQQANLLEQAKTRIDVNVGLDLNALVRRKPAPDVDLSSLIARPDRGGLSPVDLQVLIHRQAALPKPPGSVVIGGDPRAPALLTRAQGLDAATANHGLFHHRLQMFLDLAPTAWTTWGEEDARYIVQAASTQAEQSRQLSLANAVKWSSECEQAYAKPPGFLDRLSQTSKPEFYRVRLEQAREALVKVQAVLIRLQDELRFRLERIRVDALVLQVATEGESDSSRQITATRRLQTLVQVQTTGAMILQGCENTAQTCATQAGTVSDLLTVTIPNWIIAQQAR